MPRLVVANDFMVLLRGIFFFLLLTVGSLVAAAGAETLASPPMPVIQKSVGAHDAMKLTTSDHCKSVGVSNGHGTSHEGCCRDMNCGSCAHPGIASLTSIDVPAVPLDERVNATAISPMVGRNIAPETDPPKSFA